MFCAEQMILLSAAEWCVDGALSVTVPHVPVSGGSPMLLSKRIPVGHM